MALYRVFARIAAPERINAACDAVPDKAALSMRPCPYSVHVNKKKDGNPPFFVICFRFLRYHTTDGKVSRL